ncbi:2-oxo acid dehydrogenase subunit E2, partial [Escherichia coli]|uniref:2-oxo acid dehydrogenase subunit E2 n=1 Tax=Escherichia coli TaxID=562 RepID=UPI0023B1D711
SLMSTPIINPPQSAILGMHAIKDRPMAVNGEPGLLGVSNGAGVGLIAAVLLGQGQLPNWALGLCAIADMPWLPVTGRINKPMSVSAPGCVRRSLNRIP